MRKFPRRMLKNIMFIQAVWVDPPDNIAIEIIDISEFS